MASTNQQIEDELTERAVQLERLKRGYVFRMLSLLAKVEEDVLAQLLKVDVVGARGPAQKAARLATLLAAVQKRIAQYSDAVEAAILPDLEELSVDESRFGVRILSEVPPVVLDVVAPATATLKATVYSRPFQGRLLREWVRDHPAAVQMRLRGAIRQGVAQGETIDQMVRRIRGTAKTGYTDGIMQVNRRGAEAMVRTAVNHTVAAAREETYAQNEGLVKGVRWVSTLDGRTSETCRALDGRVFPMNKGPRPPAHVNCRSTTVPVLKSWKELGISLPEAPEGTRASMDGQVAASQTYSTWLAGRTKAFQDEVLGKTKAELWRKGGLELDRFVDNSGHSYTLSELRKREPKAFASAGV